MVIVSGVTPVAMKGLALRHDVERGAVGGQPYDGIIHRQRVAAGHACGRYAALNHTSRSLVNPAAMPFAIITTPCNPVGGGE